MQTADVVVLGEVAQSPRMRLHARALAEAGVHVRLWGYTRVPVPAEVSAHSRIELCTLDVPDNPAAGERGVRYAGHALLRLTRQTQRLGSGLLRRPTDVILVQTPPALPTLPLALAAAHAQGARLVVDWHNLGHTLLALRLGPNAPWVRAAEQAERLSGRRANAHLCVTQAMKQQLLEEGYAHDVTVLRDRPAHVFAPLNRKARRETRARLASTLKIPHLDQHTPLLVSATSWTQDEDMLSLLNALVAWDTDLTEAGSLLKPVVLITGKGAGRAAFEKATQQAKFQHIQVRTAWLSTEDYVCALGCADAGISMHASSSGVDVPMKVMDMLGSGLPVLSWNYGPCIEEVIFHGVNGLLFRSVRELLSHLQALFPSAAQLQPSSALSSLRSNVGKDPLSTWEEEWKRCAANVILPGLMT